MRTPALSPCFRSFRQSIAMVAGIGVSTVVVTAADPAGWSSVKSDFKEFCLSCHSAEKHKGDLDLEQFRTLEDIRKQPKVWQAVVEQMELGEMPPKDKPQPTAVQREAMLDWTRATLDQLALEKAGDPGPVLLRRLSNAEYTHTIRDLTGVPSLDPAQEFPVDGAAGEGFVNTGQSLVISPSLLTKYLDAAKGVASHAVLLPDRIAFSPHTTRRDQTEDLMGRIRTLYRKYSDASGADRVNLQGIIFDTNEGGRVPVARYLTATIEDRAALAMGAAEIERVAKARGLSPVYLGKLYSALRDERASFLLDPIRERWRKATVAEVPALVADITAWQAAVWKFSPVGHIGKLGGPKAWMEPVTPVLARQELRMKVPAEPTTGDWTVYLAAGNAGDGATGDVVRWVQPRLSIAGKPEIPLAGLRSLVGGLEARRDRFAAGIGKYLTAAAESASATSGDLDAIASKHGIRRDDLVLWLDYLGLGASGAIEGDGSHGHGPAVVGRACVRQWLGQPGPPEHRREFLRSVGPHSRRSAGAFGGHASVADFAGGGRVAQSDGRGGHHPGRRATCPSGMREWRDVVGGTAAGFDPSPACAGNFSGPEGSSFRAVAIDAGPGGRLGLGAHRAKGWQPFLRPDAGRHHPHACGCRPALESGGGCLAGHHRGEPACRSAGACGRVAFLHGGGHGSGGLCGGGPGGITAGPLDGNGGRGGSGSVGGGVAAVGFD